MYRAEIYMFKRKHPELRRTDWRDKQRNSMERSRATRNSKSHKINKRLR